VPKSARRAPGLALFDPVPKSLDLLGLQGVSLPKLLEIDRAAWLKECDDLKKYFELFGFEMPKELLGELDALRKRLSKD